MYKLWDPGQTEKSYFNLGATVTTENKRSPFPSGENRKWLFLSGGY